MKLYTAFLLFFSIPIYCMEPALKKSKREKITFAWEVVDLCKKHGIGILKERSYSQNTLNNTLLYVTSLYSSHSLEADLAIRLIKPLVDAGADINYGDDTQTPLMNAVYRLNYIKKKHRIAMLRELLGNGAQINLACKNKSTALSTLLNLLYDDVSSNADREILHILLESGAQGNFDTLSFDPEVTHLLRTYGIETQMDENELIGYEDWKKNERPKLEEQRNESLKQKVIQRLTRNPSSQEIVRPLPVALFNRQIGLK